MSEIIHTFYQLNEEEKQELSEKYSGNFDVVKVSDSGNSKKRYYGKMTYANGDIYEGEWKDDLFDGHGKYTWVNGEVYEGQWKDGVKNGLGKHTCINGDVYEGEHKYGQKNRHPFAGCLFLVIRLYASTSTVNPDLNSTVIFLS